jgi:hypothetical protein
MANQINIVELENRLNYTITKTDELLSHFNNTSGNEIHFFCLHMLERLNFSSVGLSTIAKEILIKTQLEYSAGIILRTVLLDYMIVLNAQVIIVKNLQTPIELHEKLKNFCSIMLSDCINHTINSIKKLRIPQKDLKKIYTGIVQAYPDDFEQYNNDGSCPIVKEKKSFPNGKLFEDIFNSKEFRKYSDVYQAYLFYSKYDHFGKMYYDLLRHDFKNRFFKLNESVKVFPRKIMFVTLILIILYPNDKFLEKYLAEVHEYNNTF